MASRSAGERVREGRITWASAWGGTTCAASGVESASPMVPGCTTRDCIQRWRASRAGSGAMGGGGQQRLLAVGGGLPGLGVDGLEVGDVFVPLVERGHRPGALAGEPIELPDLVH